MATKKTELAGVGQPEKPCPARGHQSIPSPHVIMQQGTQENSVCTTQSRETWEEAGEYSCVLRRNSTPKEKIQEAWLISQSSLFRGVTR